MKVFVIIAVFNRIEHTLHVLKCLEAQSFQEFDVVVVDDGSSDGTTQIIQKQFPKVILVQGDGSWWWARSMNEGFKLALAKGADVLITLNNDVNFNKELIASLLHLHRQKPKSLIGCLNIVVKKQKYIFFSGIKAISWWKAKEYKYHKAFTLLDKPLRGLHASKCLNGRGTLIPVEVFNAIGLYDNKHFPQYAADYDYTLRAARSGFKSWISWDNTIESFIEETGAGRSFIRQSWRRFMRSFFNPYASTSWRMFLYYYYRHAGIQLITGLPCQFGRILFAFYRKRHVVEELS